MIYISVIHNCGWSALNGKEISSLGIQTRKDISLGTGIIVSTIKQYIDLNKAGSIQNKYHKYNSMTLI
jgi:hypothetical protein